MSKTKTLEYEQKVNVPPEVVYHAFTNRTGIREWLCDSVEVDSREGGRLHLWWNSGFHMTGEFTNLEEHKAVAYTWNGSTDPGPMTVSVTLKPDGDGTMVVLKQDGIGAGEEWAETVAEIEKGWQESLENLASVLETGIDLRVARRPLVGILVGDVINEENAARYGLPGDANGVVVAGTLPESGAEAVGMTANDVILRVEGIVVGPGGAFARAIAGKRAGDVVEVVYWHDGEEITVQMPLSARPMPEVPDSPKDLAKAVKANHDQVAGELTDILEGLSEKEASHRPAEGEWSVKEIIAHLILSERVIMYGMAVMVAGQELRDFPGNIQAQIDAVLAAYPTLDDLRAELQRAQAEVVAFIAAMPEDFVRRKATYVRMGQNVIQGVIHPQAHFEQMKAAIKAARE
jgi:uncharacterized protein YndB with AHSA1/START domain